MEICGLKHPFLNSPGSSQLTRTTNALRASGLDIDGRQLADYLFYIYRFSRQVSFHKYQSDKEDGEYMLLEEWSKFFEKSVPFLLARISKYDLKEKEEEFNKLRTSS